MQDMYNLYKSVFNNITISKIIWNQVRFEHYVGDQEECYNQGLSKLITTKDITIEYLLSNELYSLFDDYIDYYFKIVVNDKSSKYWQCLIFELTKTEIELILNYKSLGFKRFKLIYQHFGQNFKSNGSIVLLNAAKSGNCKIFQFLLQQGYQLPNKVSRYYSKLECGGNMEIFTELFNFYRETLNKEDPDELGCILQHFIEKNQITQYSIILMDYPQVYGDKTELVLLGLALKYSNCILIDRVITYYGIGKLAIGNLKDIKFIKSRFPYQTENYSKSFHDTYSNLSGTKTTHIIDFKTFMYYLSKIGIDINDKKHSDDIHNFLKSVELKNYTFENSNSPYTRIVIHLLLTTYCSKIYYPTLQEFKLITSKINLTGYGMDLLQRLSIHISNVLNDIEYMDYFLKYIYSQEDKNKKKEKENEGEDQKGKEEDSIGFQLPPKALDTRFEMAEFLVNNYRDKLITKEMLVNFDLYKNQNSFFGDVRTARLYLSLIPISPTNKFYSLENGFAEMAFKNGYLELIQFYISIKRFSRELTFNNLYFFGMGGNFNYCHFEIFKYILSLKSNSATTDYTWLIDNKKQYFDFIEESQFCKKPYFKHFIQSLLIANGGKFNLEFKRVLESNDIQLFKLFSKLDGKLLNLGENGSPTTPFELSLLFEQANYKILDYVVNQLNVKPSNSKTVAEPGLFHVLFDNDPKRLCWFIENDKEFIIQNTDKLIDLSCDHQSTYCLNLIFSLSSFSNDWKLNLLIKVLNLSITLSNNIEKEEDEEVVKVNKKEKKEEKEEKQEDKDEEIEEFDPYQYNSSDEESESEDDDVEEEENVEIESPYDSIPWILKLQFNLTNADKQSIKRLLKKKELISINRYYLESIQPDLDQYEKLNSTIINLIDYLQ